MCFLVGYEFKPPTNSIYRRYLHHPTRGKRGYEYNGTGQLALLAHPLPAVLPTRESFDGVCMVSCCLSLVQELAALEGGGRGGGLAFAKPSFCHGCRVEYHGYLGRGIAEVATTVWTDQS